MSASAKIRRAAAPSFSTEAALRSPSAAKSNRAIATALPIDPAPQSRARIDSEICRFGNPLRESIQSAVGIKPSKSKQFYLDLLGRAWNYLAAAANLGFA